MQSQDIFVYIYALFINLIWNKTKRNVIQIGHISVHAVATEKTEVSSNLRIIMFTFFADKFNYMIPYARYLILFHFTCV